MARHFNHHLMQAQWTTLLAIMLSLQGCGRRVSTFDTDRLLPDMAGAAVQAEWLVDHLQDDSLIIIDARPSAQFQAGHIPGAVNADWTQLLPDGLPVSFRLLPPESLAVRFCRQGLPGKKTAVCYADPYSSDSWGEEGALYWILDFSTDLSLYVLDGGFTAWKQGRRPVETGQGRTNSLPCSLSIIQDSSRVATAGWIATRLHQPRIKLLDARSRQEYDGILKYTEDRYGRIPGAVWFHWRDGLNADGSMKDSLALATRFAELGIIKTDTIVTYCTGGVRSGFVYFLLKHLGYPSVRNYEGSFEEWSADPLLPVER